MAALLFASAPLCSCSSAEDASPDAESLGVVNDALLPIESDAVSEKVDSVPSPAPELTLGELRSRLSLTEDFRADFAHGDKTAEYQKYIVLHDTEGEADANSIISWWETTGNMVAAHFIVNKDGTITQCVPLDSVAHHAGFGDTGNNERYGVLDESRDDKAGTISIGNWAADYGMNSYSVGIEMVHVGGSGLYPKEQLAALDTLIAYIDACYGFQSTIIDHKAWRSGNSDTSLEFAEYLINYQTLRKYSAQ